MAYKVIEPWCQECDNRTSVVKAYDGFTMRSVCRPCSVMYSKLRRVVNAATASEVIKSAADNAKLLNMGETDSTVNEKQQPTD